MVRLMWGGASLTRCCGGGGEEGDGHRQKVVGGERRSDCVCEDAQRHKTGREPFTHTSMHVPVSLAALSCVSTNNHRGTHPHTHTRTRTHAHTLQIEIAPAFLFVPPPNATNCLHAHLCKVECVQCTPLAPALLQCLLCRLHQPTGIRSRVNTIL